MANEIKDTWERFFAHWIASTLGFFFRSLLPVLQSWQDPVNPIQYPRWWVALLFSASISIIGGAINSNMPCKPRELVKSMSIGFALDSASVLAGISPTP